MRSKLLFIAALPFLLISLIISLYHLAYSHKIYPFVRVGSSDISNLKLNQAEAKISQNLPQDLDTISLTFGGQGWPVDLKQLEIGFNPLSSAQNAYVRGRSDNFFKDLQLKWQQWRRPVNLPLVFSLNEGRLDEVVNAAIASGGEEPIQPALVLNQKNEVELISGRNGRVVDQRLLRQQFKDRVGRLDFSPLEIPILPVSVDVSPEQLAAAEALANELKNKKLTVSYQDFSQTIKGQPLLDLINFGGGFDEVKIASLAAEIAQKLNRSSQNAAFKFDGAKVVEFKPALPGLKLDQTASAELIKQTLQKLAESGEDQNLDLIVDRQEPANSIAEVNSWGIKELLGQGESSFRGSIPGRKHNISLAAGRINGLLVAPGETFSFNQAVGDISKETGYQQAFIIKDGRTILGDGGGVCQVSTTLFRAVLNAGLEILERHPHSYRVGYYEQNAPAGLDATVFAPSVDLKFKNDTQNHILIQATTDLSNSRLKFEIYGASDGRKAAISHARLWDQTPPPPDLYIDGPSLPSGQVKQIDWKAWGGKAAFDWTVTRSGEALHQKTFYSSYQPWQAVFLRGTK